MNELKKKIDSNPVIKKMIHRILIPKNQATPRLWVKLILNRFFHKRKGAVIRSRSRLDLFPFNDFRIGHGSIIEDFTTINNGVGHVAIGSKTIIGLGSVVIGPAFIGDDVMLAQNVVISGLNHNYENIFKPISEQGVETKNTAIQSGSWIGANAVIVPGVKVGRNSIVAAGSVVTKDVPDFCIVAGNPAKVVKTYNASSAKWEKVNKVSKVA